MRDELLAIEQFDSPLEAQVLVADWRIEYNTYRPHSIILRRQCIRSARRLKPSPFRDARGRARRGRPELAVGGPAERPRSLGVQAWS